MKISKTLFNNLSRCPNAPALYEIETKKEKNNVKSIVGLSIDKNTKEPISLDCKHILNKMYDEKTGESLLDVSDPQMEAYRDQYVEVERLASIFIANKFNINVTASTNTYKQKKFSFLHNDNEYYCYLDIFSEDDNILRVFEVKSTTDKKYLDLLIKNKKLINPEPLYVKNELGIYKNQRDVLINKVFNGFTFSDDVLTKKEDKLFDRYSDEGIYIHDLAVQRFFIEQSFLAKAEEPKVEYYLVILNSQYIYDGKTIDGINVYDSINSQELFSIFDMNYETKKYQNIIDKEMQFLELNINNLKIIPGCINNHCLKDQSRQCKYFNICNEPALKDGGIYEYLKSNYAFSNINPKPGDNRKNVSIYELINEGIYTMEDAEPFLSKIDNITQLKCLKNNERYIETSIIKKILESIQYPIYHLDFESFMPPLPRFNGEKPYSQSLFQYSVHVEKEGVPCDIVKDHLEYLAPDHKDHRKDLVEKLIKDIDLSNGGTVLVYNESFERTRINELSELFPEYKNELLNLNAHMFDLLKVLKGDSKLYEKLNISSSNSVPSFTFYDVNLHGSFSIKKVLPLFTDLNYMSLDVKNGTEAVLAYAKLKQYTKEEYDHNYNALRIYCRQDTWAMVKILEGLRKL